MPCTSGASTSAPSTTTVGSTIAHAYQWRSKLRRRRPGSRVGRSGASGSDGAGAGVTSVADIGPPGTAGTTGGETGGRVVRRAGAPPVEPRLGAGLHGRRGGSLGGVVRDHVALVLLSGLVERSEEHTSELQSLTNLVCRLLLEKKKKKRKNTLYVTKKKKKKKKKKK